MRLNRANAAVRDQQRERDSAQRENVQNQACANLWRELVGESHMGFIIFRDTEHLGRGTENWKRRTQLVEYCTAVVDQPLNEKRAALQEQGNNPTQRRKIQAEIFEDEVKVCIHIIPAHHLKLRLN